MNTTEQLCDFIRTNLVSDGVQVTADTPFEKLGLDSFSLIEIILFIERKFGVTIPDKDLNKENLFSVTSLVECLERNRTI